MKYKINYNLFNDFWFNCKTTILYTILSTKLENYKEYVYCNDYTYIIKSGITDSGKEYKYFDVDLEPCTDRLHETIIEENISSQILGKEDEISEIKRCILEGNIVLLWIDMYYWMPDSISYHKYHHHHFSIISGFDEETDIFYAIDNNGRLGEFTITTDELLKARLSCIDDHKPDDIIIYKLKNIIKSDTINISSLKENAKNIVKSINELLRYDYWVYNEEDYHKFYDYDMTSFNMARLSSRMLVNKGMLDNLLQNHYSEGLENLYKDSIEIEEGWRCQKTYFYKIFRYKDPIRRIEKFNKEIKKLLIREMKLWNDFIQLDVYE